jgi:hypothetical protein
VPNAQLRLIVSKTQPTGRGDNNYNWVLIKSDNLRQKSYVEQLLSGTTNVAGRFEFRNVEPGRYLQLAYWGKGVPESRSLAFDESRPGESDVVTIKLPAPAVLRGKLDRGQLHDADSIMVMGHDEAFQKFEIKLDKEQSSFEFAELPPGKYSVGVYSKPVPFTENGAQMYRTSPIAGQNVSIKAGETKELEFRERQERP